VKTIRVEALSALEFDLSVPEGLTDAEIYRRVVGQLAEVREWFDSLPKPTVIGDGNVVLTPDAHPRNIDWWNKE
jgi:hypothetical protein